MLEFYDHAPIPLGETNTGREDTPPPTKGKRFEVSRDVFSRERLEALKKLHEELKKDLPEYIGLTIFGSLSKGKDLTEKSAQVNDIDLNVWVDSDKLVSNIKTGADRYIEVQKNFEDYKSTYGDEHEESQYLIWAIEKYIRGKFDDILPGVLIHGEPRLVMLFGEEIISRLLSGLKSSIDDMRLSEDGTKPRDEKLKYLTRIFHLNIGDRVNNYRTRLLSKLKAEGVYGQKLWEEILENMIADEGKKRYGESVPKGLYPSPNLDEAMRYYDKQSRAGERITA